MCTVGCLTVEQPAPKSSTPLSAQQAEYVMDLSQVSPEPQTNKASTEMNKLRSRRANELSNTATQQTYNSMLSQKAGLLTRWLFSNLKSCLLNTSNKWYYCQYSKEHMVSTESPDYSVLRHPSSFSLALYLVEGGGNTLLISETTTVIR